MESHKIVFSIVEQHIAKGVGWHREECPGALAIIDRVASGVSVSLDEYSVSLIDSSGGKYPVDGSMQRFCQEAPEDLCDFTYRYDRRQQGAPVEFVLDVPEWAYSAEKAANFRLLKTPVRVAAVNRNQGWMDVVVPRWHLVERIRLKKDMLPENVFLTAAPNKLLHAWVNIANDVKAALYFADWE